MPAVLTEHSYGKSRIRLTKVSRLADRHEVRELTIEIELEGEFAGSYTIGDNRLIIPTDTMKNVAYALAREHPLESIEDFGAAVASHFLANHSHVDAGDRPPGRAAAGADSRRRPRASPRVLRARPARREPAPSCGSRRGLRVESGLDELFLLKSTDSSFCGFLRDRYTTLPDASDRILATMLKADWLYSGDAAPTGTTPTHCIRQALLETFAGHQSLSVQQTLHAMGAAALEACPEIERITLVMPNQHRILVDLKPFGLENANEVFLATDEPHGTITGTLQRA